MILAILLLSACDAEYSDTAEGTPAALSIYAIEYGCDEEPHALALPAGAPVSLQAFALVGQAWTPDPDGLAEALAAGVAVCGLADQSAGRIALLYMAE